MIRIPRNNKNNNKNNFLLYNVVIILMNNNNGDEIYVFPATKRTHLFYHIHMHSYMRLKKHK